MTTLRSRTESISRPHQPHTRLYQPQGPTTAVPVFEAGYAYPEVPWRHMAQTYEWVGENTKPERTTARWVLEQQVFVAASSLPGPSSKQIRSPPRPRRNGEVWTEVVYTHAVEPERRFRREQEVRRMSLEREKEKARIVQEEMRRIEARIRERREAERQKLAEQRAQAQEHQRRQTARAERAVARAWKQYEERWAEILNAEDELTFASIPWPVVIQPLEVEEITAEGIEKFLLSGSHSQKQTRKERIRNGQLRWHPDRFRRIMGRIVEKDIEAVELGVGVVARCLNDLMYNK